MDAFWKGLSALQRVFFMVAAPSTVILVIQMIMLFMGGAFDMPDTDGYDADTGGEDEGGINAADAQGLRVFSVSGVLGLLTVTGWSGFALLGAGFDALLSIVISIMLGTAAMFGIAFLIRALMRLSESGNIDYRYALGKTASVYLTIPPYGGGQGKINLVIGEALREFSAVTQFPEPIPTGASVRIVDLSGEVFTVEPEL